MWYETLSNYERKQAKAEGRIVHAKRSDQRRLRRALRKNLEARRMNIDKYEKWVSRQFTSSNCYRYAYISARAEKNYYDRIFY